MSDSSSFRAVHHIYHRMFRDLYYRDITFVVTNEPKKVAWNYRVTLWAYTINHGHEVTVNFPKGDTESLTPIEYAASMGCGFVWPQGDYNFIFLESKLILYTCIPFSFITGGNMRLRIAWNNRW